MADRIKGITVEIGGDTTGLSKALNGVNKNIKNTQSQLKDVERLLKLDPANTELLSQKQKLLAQAVGETKGKLDTLKKANEGVTADNAKYEQWKAAYAPIQGEITKTTDKLETLQKQQKEMERAGEVNTEAYQKLQSEIEKTGGKLEQLDQKATDAYNELGRPISTEQYDALQREIVDTEQQLHSLEGQAERSGAAVAKIADAGGKLEALGGKISGVGQKLAPVSAAAAGVLGASAKMSMDFEDAMAKVSTIADDAEVPLSDLQKSIIDLSNQTGISSTEIADNVYNAISAGQKTGDAVNFVANSTKLARAGFTDAGSSLDVLTTIMNAYGLEAGEVNRVSDILIQTQNLGKTTVGDLASTMGKIIPTAKANGVALDQVAAGYAIMTSNGVGTAESTTYMNAMLDELGKSGTKVSKTLKERTGQSFKELMDGGASLSDILQIVSDGAKEQGLAFGDLWGSAQAGKAGLVLLGDSAEDFNGTLEQMQNSAGATETAFGKLDTNSYKIQKSFNQLKNTAIELGSSVMEVLAPVIEAIATKIKEFSKWFSGLGDGQKKIIVIIGLVVAALAPLLIIIGTVISAIGGIVPVIAGIVPAIAGIVLPIVAVIAAIGLLVAAFIALYNNNEEFRAGVAEIWNSVQEVISTVVEVIKDVITAFVETGKALWEQYGTGVMAVVTSAFDFVKNVIDTALTFIKNLINVVMAVIRGDWSGAWEGIKKLISDLAEGIKKIISSWMETVKNTIKLAVSVVTGFFTGLKNGVVEIFTNLKTAVGEKVGRVKDSIVEGIGKAVDWVKELPAKALQWGKDFIQGLINGIKGKIGEVGDAVKAIADKIKSFLHFSRPDVGPLREYETWMPDMMTGLSRGIKDNVWRITDQLSGLTGKISYAVNGPGAAQEGKAADLSKIEGLLSYYLPKGKDGTAIVLDDETLVGRTAPSINKQLADRMRYEGRGMA